MPHGCGVRPNRRSPSQLFVYDVCRVCQTGPEVLHAAIDVMVPWLPSPDLWSSYCCATNATACLLHFQNALARLMLHEFCVAHESYNVHCHTIHFFNLFQESVRAGWKCHPLPGTVCVGFRQARHLCRGSCDASACVCCRSRNAWSTDTSVQVCDWHVATVCRAILSWVWNRGPHTVQQLHIVLSLTY